MNGRLRNLGLRAAAKLPSRWLSKLKKAYYVRLLRLFSEEREPDLAIVQHLVHTGDCVVDVGANIGVYTKFLSQMVGEKGCVYSIEPVPGTFEILKANVAALGLTNVRLRQCAISDSEGQRIMVTPFKDTGLEDHYLAHIVQVPADPSPTCIRVEAATIDSLLPDEVHPVSFVKIDTEGHELPCIRGASHTIERDQPALLVEMSSDFGKHGSESFKIIDLLSDHGYRPWWYDRHRLRAWQEGDRSVNYFLLHSKHVDRLQRVGIAIHDVNERPES